MTYEEEIMGPGRGYCNAWGKRRLESLREGGGIREKGSKKERLELRRGREPIEKGKKGKKRSPGGIKEVKGRVRKLRELNAKKEEHIQRVEKVFFTPGEKGGLPGWRIDKSEKRRECVSERGFRGTAHSRKKTLLFLRSGLKGRENTY